MQVDNHLTNSAFSTGTSAAKIVAVLVVISACTYLQRDMIFQRGNPIPYLYSITKITEETPLVAVDEQHGIYISKKADSSNLEYVEQLKNLQYVDQYGSSYLFTDGTKECTVETELYWGDYVVWMFSAAKDEA